MKEAELRNIMPKSPFTEAQIERIQALCISRTQRLISEMATSSASGEHQRFGHSPTTWLLGQGSKKHETGLVEGPLLKHWVVTADSAELVEVHPVLPRELSGMYYTFGSASFFLHQHEPLLWYDYTVGPRYGRGQRIEISLSATGEPYFQRERSTWLS
ncbi:MAG: hypothetical protein IPK32_04400 [Verrucomicrobiaceae bacterium]|nr:hypothetical protein [Verrucomicrobiaceae bacterium]